MIYQVLEVISNHSFCFTDSENHEYSEVNAKCEI